jgi:hypothetical protein
MKGWSYWLLRGLVTLVYLVAIGFAFGWALDPRGTLPFPFALVAYTAAYAILMMLLWLHERYRPRQ